MVGITGLKKMKMYKNVYSYSTITFIKSLDIQLKDYFHHVYYSNENPLYSAETTKTMSLTKMLLTQQYVFHRNE